MDVEQIRAFVGADSLHYLSLDGLIDAVPQPAEALCTACFTGRYPIPVPAEEARLSQIALAFDPDGSATSEDARSVPGADEPVGR
jgi:amidophosphoribosyltransferase